MEKDSFEIMTDVKRVATLTDASKRQMFADDISDTATVYIDGHKYYAEIPPQKFFNNSNNTFRLNVDLRPKQSIEDDDEPTIIVDGGLVDWQITGDSLVIKEHPQQDNYGIVVYRASVTIFE